VVNLRRHIPIALVLAVLFAGGVIRGWLSAGQRRGAGGSAALARSDLDPMTAIDAPAETTRRGTGEEWLALTGVVRRIGRTDGETAVFVRLRPAAGVTIPRGSFTCAAIRFNEQGEVVEIVEDASRQCIILAAEDPDTGEFLLTCLGTCTPASLQCPLIFDFQTLSYRCPCL
jgi:hypothetical protein